MKLVVPHLGEPATADARLIRLAEFLGIECQPLRLASPALQWAIGSGSDSMDRAACIVINPRVIKEWMDGEIPSTDFFSSLLSTFRHVLVHAVNADSFDSRLIAALSGGQLQGVLDVQDSGAPFDMAADSRDICESFAGLSLGSASPANDRTFPGGGTECTRRLITVGGEAFLVSTKREDAEILFVGSRNVSDLDAEPGDEWLTESFSRFLPHAMVLRHVFGEHCWRPTQHRASVIVDDPLLQANYGFLNFKHLLGLTELHNFHTTIAFIPHNFRRTSAKMAKLFRENSGRLSLCFHGNDHTGGEFASTDSGLIDTMLQIAERRMQLHSELNGLDCDRVMVFPQGSFSIEAMDALNSHNFDAAVNTVPHPRQQEVRLTLREVAQPAVLRYSGFPLFLRKNSLKTQATEIAFKLFFGIPILIVEHHDVFKEPQSLIDAVNRINVAAPGIRWSGAGEAVRGSILGRRAAGGTLQLRAYARRIRIENSSKFPERIVVEWARPGLARSLEAVRRNGVPCADVELSDSHVRVSAVLEPGVSEVFSIHHQRPDTTVGRMSFGYSTRAFVRRRLSEIRDNYICRSPALLAATKTLRRSLRH
jgi:hypothetical protein